MTGTGDPQDARRRADEAADRAEQQLADARAKTASTAARSRRSGRLLDRNHLSLLFQQALGLGGEAK